MAPLVETRKIVSIYATCHPTKFKIINLQFSYHEVFLCLLCCFLMLHFNHGPTQENIFALSPLRRAALVIS